MCAVTTATPKLDATAAAAVDAARAALLEEAPASDVGEHLGVIAEWDRVVTHLFACSRAGYRGWRWSVATSRPPRCCSSRR